MKALKVVVTGFFLFFVLFLGFQSYAIAAKGITVSPIDGFTPNWSSRIPPCRMRRTWSIRKVSETIHGP